VPADVTEILFPVLSDIREADWRDRALCAEVDPDLHFPERGAPTRPAKTVCAACEVRAECLEYALEHGEAFGVWGGLSEHERRRLRSERAASHPPVCGNGLHLMDEANTYTYPNGHRACRACRKSHEQRRKEAA
jgi:WhiB family transcriptional regulator, redox-sensing transcriptional regulator